MTELEFWLRYFAVWSGLPPIGDPLFANVIIAQSFGRNSIPDEKLFKAGYLNYINRNNDDKNLHELLKSGFDPGKPNMGLAMECMRLVDRYFKPLICQWEIGAAILKKEPCWFNNNTSKIHCVWPEAKLVQKFTTPDVLYAAKEIMDKNQWKKPIIVAHRMHIARVYFLARKIINKQITITDQQTSSFDRNSVQRRMKNIFFWLCWESGARFHHLLKL